MRTAYSYIRFSTPEQRKGNSLERQLETTRSLAKKNGWGLDTSLSLQDLGKSAFKGGQQIALQGFLVAIEEGRVAKGSVLIVENLDRLSREDVDVALQLFLRIVQAGVDIATLNPEQIHTRQTIKDIAGLIVPLVAFAEANRASAGKSQRAFDNWERKRKRGGPLTTRCPAWVRIEGGKFVLIPAKAKIIRQIFRWCVDGLGARQITQKLNQGRIPNIAEGTRVNSTSRWSQNYVELILRTKAVVGEYQPCKLVGSKRIPEGNPIAGYFPAVVDEETYYAAQAAKKSRFTQRGNPGNGIANLFTGIMFDARNGSTMRLVSPSKTEKAAGTERRLASYHGTLGAAKYLSWKYEQLESAVLMFLAEITADDLSPKAVVDDRLPGLMGRLGEVERKIAGIEGDILGDADYRALVGVLKRLANEKTSLLAGIEAEKINRSKHREDAAGESSILLLLNQAKGDERLRLRNKLKATLRLIVSEIWVLIDDVRTDERPSKTVEISNRLKVKLGSRKASTRTCTIQMFFEDGSCREIRLEKNGRQTRFLECKPRHLAGSPQHDLRYWRYHCSPRGSSLIQQEPLPTPDGTGGLAYATRNSRQAAVNWREPAGDPQRPRFRLLVSKGAPNN